MVVGFISVSSDVDLKQLHSFELSEFDGLYKQIKHDEAAAQPASSKVEEDSQQVI